MKVVDFAGLLAMPPNTVFCPTTDGYADSLELKSENAENNPDEDGATLGFLCLELLPQPAGSQRWPRFQEQRHWPSNGHEPGDTFFVLEPDEVRHLIGMLQLALPGGNP